MTEFKRVQLTDTEWMQLIDGNREDSSLPVCCANISALRDFVIDMARNGGEVNMFTEKQLEMTLGWCVLGHDLGEFPVLVKMCEQLGLSMDPKDYPEHKAVSREY